MQNIEELFRSLARPAIRDLEPYDASVSGNPLIRVSANENNEGLPESVLTAMRNALAEGNRYPDSLWETHGLQSRHQRAGSFSGKGGGKGQGNQYFPPDNSNTGQHGTH